MNQFSKKRLREIASGKVKLNHNSTTKRMSVERFRELRDKGNKALLAALRGDGGEMSSSVVDRVFGKAKAPQNERTKAIKEADRWFSLFIRLRDSGPDGRVTCVTCSHTGPWKSLQCGHFVTRGHQSTRYDERNSNTQCRGCNYNGGQHLKHATAIDRKYGEGTATAIEQKGRMRCKRTLADLLAIASDFKARVENMRQQSPGKFSQ